MQAILFGIIPLAGYLYAYVYENAYASFFRLPRDFLTVAWYDALSPAIVGTALALALIVAIGARFAPVAPDPNNKTLSTFLNYFGWLTLIFSLTAIAVFMNSPVYSLSFFFVALQLVLIMAQLDIRQRADIPDDAKPVNFRNMLRAFISWRAYKAQVVETYTAMHYIPLRTWGLMLFVIGLVLGPFCYYLTRSSPEKLLPIGGQFTELGRALELVYWAFFWFIFVAGICGMFAMAFGRNRVIISDPGFYRQTSLIRLVGKIGVANYVLLFVAVALLGAFAVLGRVTAQTQQKFLFISTGEPAIYVVLRKYGDEVVTARYEKDAISQTFRVFRLDDNSRGVIMSERTIPRVFFTTEQLTGTHSMAPGICGIRGLASKGFPHAQVPFHRVAGRRHPQGAQSRR